MGSVRFGTNNEAEHRGCVSILRLVLDELQYRVSSKQDGPGMLKVEVYGDSNLVINQASGKWETSKEHLQTYVTEERRLIRCIQELSRDGFTISHVLRHENKSADKLANLGMDQI